ncbi:hypothetical protein JW859_12870 [bacterium]|nr:hypothetical protein [bacterium]
MKDMMIIIILAVIYLAYVLLGIDKGFPVAFVDWRSPFGHYDVLTAKQLANGLALPVVVILCAGAAWYRKGMIGEA